MVAARVSRRGRWDNRLRDRVAAKRAGVKELVQGWGGGCPIEYKPSPRMLGNATDLGASAPGLPGNWTHHFHRQGDDDDDDEEGIGSRTVSSLTP